MPSQMISATFAYPFAGSRISEPPGLTNNVGSDWSRIHLAGDLAVDIPPDTKVMTDQGFLLPEDLVSRKASLVVSTGSGSISVNGSTAALQKTKAYKVISVTSLSQNEAQVDQLGDDPELGGNSEGALSLQNPIPAETCECVLLNQSCNTRHENLNDLVSFSF